VASSDGQSAGALPVATSSAFAMFATLSAFLSADAGRTDRHDGTGQHDASATREHRHSGRHRAEGHHGRHTDALAVYGPPPIQPASGDASVATPSAA
jgi:hypothetical protein